jgi:quinol-cytochrome oxidoreductase complex cytochrome b subunit
MTAPIETNDDGRRGISARTRSRWRNTALYRSVVRTPPHDSPTGRALRSFGNVFLHVYPVRVPTTLLSWRATFRLGFIAVVLFAILLITGVYLMFFYTPSVTMAYGDMQRLQATVGFGQLIRNVHRWSAHLMVLVVALHLARVFWDGAYKSPRQFNWVIGVALLIVTLAWSFTGYLLPWDQLAYWAVTVGSGLVHYVPVVGGWLRDFLLGGSTIGQSALLRFYVLHVAVLTIAFSVLLSIHVWRVRKDGFAVGDVNGDASSDVTADRASGAHEGASVAPTTTATQPDPPRRVRTLGVVRTDAADVHARSSAREVFAWPHLIVRHQVVALFTCVVVLAMGVAFDAPLRDFANPSVTPEPAKAPWYFVGVQELLAHFDPLVAGVLAPAALIVLLAALPYVDRDPARLPRERRVAVSLFLMLAMIAVGLTVTGAFFRGPGWAFVLPWQHLYFEP